MSNLDDSIGVVELNLVVVESVYLNYHKMYVGFVEEGDLIYSLVTKVVKSSSVGELLFDVFIVEVDYRVSVGKYLFTDTRVKYNLLRSIHINSR